MKLARNVRRAVAVVGVTSAIAGGAALAATTSAQAAVQHTAKICAEGNYATYLEVPQQNFTSYLAYPGQDCSQVPLVSGTTWAKVWGKYNNSGNRFYVGTAHFNSNTGWTGGAMGTTTAPWLKNFG